MNDPLDQRFRELSWRREPAEAEAAELRAWLAAHPEAAAEWEAERQLNELLQQLPEAPPVASNFTARVLQAVKRETSAARPAAHGWRSWHPWRGWLPRTAVA